MHSCTFTLRNLLAVPLRLTLSAIVDHWTVVCIVAAGLGLDVGLAVIVSCGLNVTAFSTTFHKDMSLQHTLASRILGESLPAFAYLQCVFPREALVTVVAWERLDGEMDSLMPFQVVVPVEALRTLVALEWSFEVRGRRCLR